jgi:DNA-binding transcriptional ArsR family regulator
MYSDLTTRDQRLASDANLLRQLANPKRLRICIALQGQEEDVTSLAKIMGLSQSAISQHLALLHRAGVVKVRRRAQFRYYSCNDPDVLRILNVLAHIFGASPAGLAAETATSSGNLP